MSTSACSPWWWPDVAVEGEYQFARRMVGTSPDQLRELAAWLVAQEVEEVVMESTAQYWRPVWEALERYWQPRRQHREGAGAMSGTLHLAQAQSTQGPPWTGEGFSGCGTVSQAAGGAGADAQLCARRGPTALADGDAPQVSGHAEPSAATESAGVPAGGIAH